jgi:hypothetical protein
MKIKWILAVCLVATVVTASPISDKDAVRAIIGEGANQGADGMLALGGAIRNRGHLRGVYGLKAAHVDKQPEWVWQRARLAWAMSATNDISGGADHWENVKAFGSPYWAKSMTKTVKVRDHQFYRAARREK